MASSHPPFIGRMAPIQRCLMMLSLLQSGMTWMAVFRRMTGKDKKQSVKEPGRACSSQEA